MKTNRFLCTLLTLAILIGMFTIPVMANDNIKVLLNGTELTFDVPPKLINSRTMVPMRKIFESLDAEVEWDSDTQTVTATKEDIVIIMQIDNVVIAVSGKEITLDVPPLLVDSRTLVPIRAVAEGLDADVQWDDHTQTVIITKEENAVVTPTSSTEDEELSEELFPLIDNRLLVAMPEGTVDSAMQSSIMSAPASNQEETRLMFEKEGAKVVLYAYELFRYSSGNIEDDAKILTDSWNEDSDASYSYSKMKNDKIQQMQIIPSSFNPSKDAILLRSVLVKTNDNMLIMVNLYVNQKKFIEQDNCFKLADRIFDTLEVGERTIDSSAHKEEIWLHELEIKKDYIITLNRGIDFDVYYITKIVNLGDDQPSMGIYIGGHPSGGSAPQNVDVKKVSDKIAGKNIEWISYKHNDILRMEAVFAIPDNDYVMMHIFISAYNEKELEEMKSMAQSLNSIK